MNHVDPDEVDELRFALWGSVDAATGAMAARVAAAGPASGLHARVSSDRAIRDVARRADAATTPAELMSWLRREVSGRRPGSSPGWEIPQAGDPGLLHAVPLLPAAGVRGVRGDARADRFLVCTRSAFDLEVELSVDAFARSAAVSGRLAGTKREPLVGWNVTLVVDREPRCSAETDAFGEFTFDHVCGAQFWLRVARDETVHHIVLADLDADDAERAGRT